jgi:hypothetical protein
MKILKALFLVTLTMMLVGCATPLTIQSDGKHIASKIGVKHEDIHFLSYGIFGKIVKPLIPKWKSTAYFARGMIMATQTDLYFLSGKPSKVSKNRANY